MVRTLHFSFTLLASLLSVVLLAQPANDGCFGAFPMPAFPGIQSCPDDDGTVYTANLSGNNLSATPEVPSPELNCGDGSTTGAAASVWYTFTASGAINDITVSSGSLNGIQVIGYVGTDCDNLNVRNCSTGSGSVTVRVIAQPGEQVFFTVSGTAGDTDDQGNFDIEVESSSDCDACARSDNAEVVFNPRNSSGTYACGSTVEICFTLFEFIGNEAGSVEWLHSVVPTFGPGWDVSTISPTLIPPACNGNGSWNWYPGGWTGCQTGQTFPYGFAFESNAGNDSSCAGFNNPGNNWGDGGNGCTTIPAPVTWCFNIDVLACPPGSSTFTGDDLSVSIQVFSDGTSGSWTNQLCAAPTFTSIGSVIVCDDLEPIATPTAESCPGTDDGFLDIAGNGGVDPGALYNFVVRDASSTAVYVCNACPSPVNTGSLPAGDYSVEATGVISGCPQSTQVTIPEGTAPDATADFTVVCPGQGPIQLLGSTTTAGSTITYQWEGPNGFTATGDSPFTNDPADEGTYTLTVTVDGCPSEPVDFDVAYVPFFPMVTATPEMVCFGDEVTFEVTDVGGGATFEWYDPIGNQLASTSSSITVTTTASGTQGYQVLVTEGTCSELLTVNVEVADQLLAQIVMDLPGEVCADNDINFTLQQPDGSPFPAGWTFDWDGGLGSSASYVRNEGVAGNYQVDVILTNPGGCSQLYSEVFTVNPTPIVEISPETSTICGTGSVELIPNVTSGTGPFTYLWGPNEADNITTPTLVVDGNSAETQAIYVVVTDRNGCIGYSNFADVQIIDPPAAVSIDCDVLSISELEFSWNDVGQDQFEVYVTIGAGPEMLIADDYTGLSYLVDNLSENTEVSIRIVPLGGSGGQTCPGPESTQSCTTLSCPSVAAPTLTCGDSGLDFLEISWTDTGADSYTVNVVSAPPGATTSVTGNTFRADGLNAGETVTISVTAVTQAGCPDPVSEELTCIAQSCVDIEPMITTPVDTFCADGSAGLIDLTVDVPGAGTVAWSGPGVTGDQFDPVAAGEGFHTVTVTYTEGTCMYSNSFELGVREPLTGLDMGADDTEFCVDGEVTFTINQAINFTYDVAWTVPAGATVVSGALDSPQPLTLTFGAAGPQQVSVEIAGPHCPSISLTDSVMIFAPIAPPEAFCENISFDQVGVSWSHPDGLNTGYGFIGAPPAGATITENGNSILVTGLQEGESITVSIMTFSVNACGGGENTIITCTAASCPDVTAELDDIGPFCLGDSVTVALNTTVTSAANDGVLTYEPGPGVVGTDFVTDGLASGDYQVVASYLEAGCTFTDTITVTVLPLPVATIDIDAGPVCTGQTVGADAGPVQAGFSYDWIVPSPNATVANPVSTQLNVSWSVAGTQTVGLVVTDDDGCVSDTTFVSVEVQEPLATPTIGCGASSVTSVEFGWDAVPGATGYEVSVEGGAPFTQDSTSLLVDNQSQGDLIDITVIALGSGPCGNSTAASQTCEVGSCPTITVIPMENVTFCTGGPGNVVALMATQSGGSGTGTFTFSGPGVILETDGTYSFDADAAGIGVHQIDVLYAEAICTGTGIITMTVNPTPASNFALNGTEGPLTVCVNEEFTIAYTGGLTAADGATFNWIFAGSTANPTAVFENYTASFDTPGSFDISLSIVAEGCPSMTTILTVTVDAPPDEPFITCAGADLNSITFNWIEVPGAIGYELNDGTVLPPGTTAYTVTGLLPGQDTSIMVTALSDNACGNSTPANSETCTTQSCPPIAIDADNVERTVCLENGDETIDLSSVVAIGGIGNGTFTFSGPGVTGSTFDAATAGGSEAGTVHTITVDYVEDGPCTASTTIELTVFLRPSAFITTAEPACIGEPVQLTVGSTNFVQNQDITIDFDGGTLLNDGDPDDTVYLVSWDTPGTKTVTATVISNISGCPSLPVTQEVVIESPLATPVVSCPATAELEEITFSWEAVPGASGYEVTTQNGTPDFFDASTTSVTVGGLSPETTISITVTALGNGPCRNSESATISCVTAPCPGGSVQTVTPPTQLCLDGSQAAFPLEAELNMGTPSGPFVWSGTGVVDNGDGTYAFDPVGLSAGTYELMVEYLGEANCTSTDELTVTLFAPPASDFGVSANVVCTNTETTVGLIGSIDPDATYTWDFDGAAQTATGSPETYDLSWPTAGTYTISLTATANGCETFSSFQVTVDEPATAGTPAAVPDAFCAGSANAVRLADFVTGEDDGGTWSVAPSSPSNVGNVDVSTGTFNTSALTAGDYVFRYEVQRGSCPAATVDVSLSLLAPPVADAGAPRLLTCTMGMATLDGTGSESGDGYTYRWFSNDPSVVIMGGAERILDVSQPGTYFLEVTNAIGCSAVSEVVVEAETEAPVMEVDVSNITCFAADDGAILVTNVSGGRAPYSFTLNGEERGASTLFAGLMAQEYDLQVTDANGCFSNLILDLTEPEELTIRLRFPGDSTTANAGDEISIVASVNGGNPIDTLIWQPDSLNNGESRNGITFTASETQMISVTVVDELGCTATDREMLLVRKDRRVYFPNAFSPNGDNINDIWFIGGDLDQIEYIEDFFIFDRWGEAVYTGGQVDGGMGASTGDGSRFLPNDPNFGWDGTLKGRTMNPQTLIYTAKVKFRDGEEVVYKGDFVLMR